MVNGPEQMRYDNMWNVCINRPRNRQKGKESRMQTESKIQGNNNASRRGQPNTASRRGQKDTLSHRDVTTLPLAEAGRETNMNKLLFPHHGTRDTFELIRICWTLKTTCREKGCFQLTRNSLDTSHPRDKRCHVCRIFTAARCDHRAKVTLD